MTYVQVYNGCLLFLFVLVILPKDTRQFKAGGLIIKADQTSTNGSYVAGLACDADLNTFSLTNDGGYQSWSATLDKEYQIAWIYVRIKAGAYRISIERNGSTIDNCADNTNPTFVYANVREKITSCSNGKKMYTLGNQISIHNEGTGPLKIFEANIIGTLDIKNGLYRNFTNYPNHSNALDQNLETYHNSKEQSNASWFLVLDAVYWIKWVLVSIRGGEYELHIKMEHALNSTSTLCKMFTFSGGLKQHKAKIECDRTMRGDTIILKKTDDGSLRLFELYPIVCPPSRFGPSCARCQESCQTCHPMTGKCTQCPSSFYGDYCQYRCPEPRLNMTCHLTTGACNDCNDGYKGQRCELEIPKEDFIADDESTTKNNSQEIPTNILNSKSTTKREDDESTTKNNSQEIPTNILNSKSTTKREDGKTEDAYHSVLLSCMLVFLTVLAVVVIILFVKRQNQITGDSKESNDIFVTTNILELEEIPQDETNVAEEEVLVVEYSNLTSQRVPIGQFLEDLPNRKEEGTLEKEFDDLPFGLLENYSNAVKSSNRNRNRYKGIYPYDYNGVKLKTELVETEDYVNASYIHGFNKEKYHIAAQGPFNRRTLEDFWRMIWQNNSSRIVMLTNLYEGEKMKCLQYWPDINCTLDIGNFSISMEIEDVFDCYIARKMNVRYQEETKIVTQFHFTAWPDKSVPQDVASLINFRNLVRSGLTYNDELIVVHCSAGIGRTGTYIALDYLLEESDVDKTVDVKGYVISLRHQRGNCIQTREQYTFLHDALAEGLQQNNVQQPNHVQQPINVQQQSINAQQRCIAVL